MDFTYVGRVRHPRPEDSFLIAEVPGKVPLVIVDEGGSVLAYFDAKRRPQIGTRVGAVGEWVGRSEPATFANTPPGFPIWPHTRRIEYQVEVLAWQRVCAGYDWLLERLRAG